ncbi:MAG TPA: hypothetical protein VIK33_11510 [Anaerolineae bacterium]
MSYPAQFPYEWLDASPAENVPALQKKWGQATVKRRAQAQQVKHAFDELKNPRTRLAYDILLITDVPAPSDLSGLMAQLSQPDYLPDRADPPPITLALTDLAGDQAAFCQPVERREMPISGSKRFVAMPEDGLEIVFDRW